MNVFACLLFMIAGYLITYVAHIQTKRDQERFLQRKVSAMLKEVEEVKAACKRVDLMLADY